MPMSSSSFSGSFRSLLAAIREHATGASHRPGAVVWLGPQSPSVQQRQKMPTAVLAYLVALIVLGLTAVLLHPAGSETLNRADRAPGKFVESLPVSQVPQPAPAPQPALTVMTAKPQASEPLRRSEPGTAKVGSRVASTEASLGWLLGPEPMIPSGWPFAGGPGSAPTPAESADATPSAPQKPVWGDLFGQPEPESAAITTGSKDPGETAPEFFRPHQPDERPVQSIRSQQAERMVVDRPERTSSLRASSRTPPPPPPPEENYWRMIR